MEEFAQTKGLVKLEQWLYILKEELNTYTSQALLLAGSLQTIAICR